MDIKVDKSEDFSVRIVKLYQYLKDQKGEKTLSTQILRSGTSIGANIAESLGSESPEDYVHKLAVAQKEAFETRYWLKLLFKTNYLSGNEFESLNNDCMELINILSSIIVSIKNSHK